MVNCVEVAMLQAPRRKARPVRNLELYQKSP